MLKEIYLSPNGCDDNCGSKDSPLESLAAAWNLASESINQFSSQEQIDVEIHLGSGTYHLFETLKISLENENSNYSVQWKGAEDGSSYITSCYPLQGWRLCEDSEFTPSDSRGRVWYIDLPIGTNINSVYGPSGRIPRAKGEAIRPQKILSEINENSGYGPDGKLIDNDNDSFDIKGSFHNRFGFSKGDIRHSNDLEESEVVVIPAMQWTMNILPVKSIDFFNNIVYLKENCTYPIGIPHSYPEGSIWLENSLSLITPDSWVYHRKTGRLFYHSHDDNPPEKIEASTLCEYIRVEGVNSSSVSGNANLPRQQIANIHFQNLSFLKSNRFSFYGLSGLGLQHDWEMFDASSCMLKFKHATGCSVDNCSFHDGGSGGVRLDLACDNIQIKNSHFFNLGGCGVVLSGYGLSRNYLSRNNKISNNHIHNIGEVYWHSPAIFIWQSGDNEISGNKLHDLPYTGIVCSGRSKFDIEGIQESSKTINWDDVYDQCGQDYDHTVWHYGGIVDWWMREPLMHSRENLIEFNHIYDVMQVMGDGNGIYISGAGGGNVVRYNIVGPSPSPQMAEGIRCDDDQHQVIIHGNLVYDIGGMATGITLKGINKVTNNILAFPSTSPTRGIFSLETGPLNGGVFKRNIILTKESDHKMIGQLRIHGTGRTALLRDMDSDSNIYFCIDDPIIGDELISELQSYGIDENSISCDPGFVDALAYNFELQSDSAATKMGIKSLPQLQMYKSIITKSKISN